MDNDSVMAKTVNGFKTKLERERAKKMGLFWTDVCWSSRPWRNSGAAVLQVSCKYRLLSFFISSRRLHTL